MPSAPDRLACWPALPLDAWQDTLATLHMYTQIVGKIRLALTPIVNHWWNVPLYVSACGLTTSRIPYGDSSFEIRFDFLRHQLILETCNRVQKMLPLVPRTVADFYQDVMSLLQSAGIAVKIWRMPVEIPNPIAFDQDRVHASYDPAAVERYWRVLGRLGLPAVPRRVPGQVQPRPLLLGQLRPRRQPLLRPPRPGPPRRRRHDPRSLFA